MRGLKHKTITLNGVQQRRIFYRCVDWNERGVTQNFILSVASFTDAWIETNIMCKSDNIGKSHLLQMRGLKHKHKTIHIVHIVASFTDAWIETKSRFGSYGGNKVASFTDAWIETQQRYSGHHSRYVASFTDAWIETFSLAIFNTAYPSRIFYRCVDWNALGTDTGIPWRASHLLQMRGLKHLRLDRKHHRHSRIFYRCVDWNWNLVSYCEFRCSRIFYRCVDWNCCKDIIIHFKLSRIFYRCVDWNLVRILLKKERLGRIFYRCVDWNILFKTLKKRTKVASFTDAWNENNICKVKNLIFSRIFYRCVDWNEYGCPDALLKSVASFTDAWIETERLSGNATANRSHLLQMRGLKQ